MCPITFYMTLTWFNLLKSCTALSVESQQTCSKTACRRHSYFCNDSATRTWVTLVPQEAKLAVTSTIAQTWLVPKGNRHPEREEESGRDGRKEALWSPCSADRLLQPICELKRVCCSKSKQVSKALNLYVSSSDIHWIFISLLVRRADQSEPPRTKGRGEGGSLAPQ